MKLFKRSIWNRTFGVSLTLVAIAATLTWISLTAGCANAGDAESDGSTDTETGYTDNYNLSLCEFVDKGENPYLILMPGYQLVLEGPEGDKHETLVITITNRTKKIFLPDYGWVSTRVVEEKEWLDGIPKETALTYFAIDKKTGNVYDFGDRTDIYNEAGTEVVSHEGGWLAGQPDDDGLAHPGIFMPGTFFLGAKYYQQLAEGYSMERAHNVESGVTIDTPAGTFKNCIVVRETNWSEPNGAETYKRHAPGVGLLGEDELRLVAFGYDIFDRDTGTMKEDVKVSIQPIVASKTKSDVAAPPKNKYNRKISDEQAKKIALEEVSGEVTHIGIERKFGKQTIVVEVDADNGPETDVIIDIETGDILGTET